MNEADLKKLNRAELLTMLVSITKRCDELEVELEEANKKLEDRRIEAGKIGSLAEAALKINGVMEAADQAAAQYLENVKRMSEGGDEEAKALIESTQKRCSEIESETRSKCQKMIEDAQAESQKYWDEVYERIKNYSEANK